MDALVVETLVGDAEFLRHFFGPKASVTEAARALDEAIPPGVVEELRRATEADRRLARKIALHSALVAPLAHHV